MDWLSVADIARLTRIPAPTARRYASLFREFLPHRKTGRVTRYAPEAAGVFERIAALYQDGRVTTEIEEILRGEFSRTIDVDAAPASAPAADVRAVSPALAEMVEKFGQSLQLLADQKEIIACLREDVRKLKAGFVLLARDRKKLKALPQGGDEELRRALDAGHKSLARKDAEIEELALGLSFDTSDLKIKMQTLEQELVRLRKDRRDMERHLLDKIDRLKPS
ncbi:MAG TPA: hypothetical protein PKB11_11180 [Desulfovibrio sp.]|jgi:septal ring factor EnvC (AmiA/AmiB activator)|uniref:hypothetical protein n=1 Tax=Desulfovibrio sp. TaxID=885 RepID=UPI002C16FD0B|nr:hypothetical protein [Desulfovibrio sp.]HMM39308.1 hypothetical protein [Desulfovibrio sp.]